MRPRGPRAWGADPSVGRMRQDPRSISEGSGQSGQGDMRPCMGGRIPGASCRSEEAAEIQQFRRRAGNIPGLAPGGKAASLRRLAPTGFHPGRSTEAYP